MTVETTDLRNDFVATAGQTEITFTLRIFEDTDLELYVDGVKQTLTTDYTVAIDADPNNGGTITMTSAFAGGEEIAVVRAIPATQTADYTAFGKFPAETHERRLDVLTVLIQQILEAQARSLKYPISSDNSALEIPDPQAGYFWRWKSDLSGLENVSINDVTGIAVTPFAETLLDDSDAATFRTTLGVLAAAVFGTGADTYLRRNAGDTAWEAKSAAQVSDDLIVSRDWRGRNAIINGACQVAQISAPSISGSYQYAAVDMFAAKADGTPSAGTIAQAETTLLGRSGFALHVSGLTTGAGGAVYSRMRIESKDVRRFVNQAATFSCNVYHDVGSAVDYTITINKADAEDDFSTVTQIATSAAATSVADTTATQISLAVADMGDCSNGVEIVVSAACGAVTTKNFYTNEWQLEPGEVVTDFERESFAETLAKCQRYYHAATGFAIIFSGNVTSGGDYYAVTQFPVEMRVTPTTGVTSSAVTNFPGAVGTVVATKKYIRENRLASGTGVGIYASAYTASARL